MPARAVAAAGMRRTPTRGRPPSPWSCVGGDAGRPAAGARTAPGPPEGGTRGRGPGYWGNTDRCHSDRLGRCRWAERRAGKHNTPRVRRIPARRGQGCRPPYWGRQTAATRTTTQLDVAAVFTPHEAMSLQMVSQRGAGAEHLVRRAGRTCLVRESNLGLVKTPRTRTWVHLRDHGIGPTTTSQRGNGPRSCRNVRRKTRHVAAS